MTLFIGGEMDGTERHVQEALTTYCVYRRRFVNMNMMCDLNAEVKTDIQRYYRHKVDGVEFFALSDYSLADAMQILLAGYPRKR